MEAVLEAHVEQHPHGRPSLAEVALALAAQDGSPLADRPDLLERAATEVVARHADADGDAVLLWAEAQLATYPRGRSFSTTRPFRRCERGAHKHRQVLAHLTGIVGRRRRGREVSAVVPTSVRAEAGWDHTQPAAAAINRLRVTDHVLDVFAANVAAAITNAGQYTVHRRAGVRRD